MYRGNHYGPGELKSPFNPMAMATAQSPYFQLMHNPVIERLFEASPAFIYVLNIKTQRIVYTSPNLYQLFGYNHEDVIDRTEEDITRLLARQDAAKVLDADCRFMEAIAANTLVSSCLKNVVSYHATRYDGSIVPVQLQKVVLETDSNGIPLMMMTMITDTTCGKKNHEFSAAIMHRDEQKGWTIYGPAGSPLCDLLSTREKEILRLLALGKSSKIIASELDISVNTVNNHRKNMLLKTRSNNIAGLVSYGLSHGII